MSNFIIVYGETITRAFLIPQLVKNPLAIQESWVPPLGWEDPLEKGKATHSSILVFHGLYSPWGSNESDMTERLSLLIDLNLVLLFILFIYSFFFQKNSDIVDI